MLAGCTSEVELPHASVLQLERIAERHGATFMLPHEADGRWCYAFRFDSAATSHNERSAEAIFTACARAGLIDPVTRMWRTSPLVEAEVTAPLPWIARLRMAGAVAWSIMRGRAIAWSAS